MVILQGRRRFVHSAHPVFASLQIQLICFCIKIIITVIVSKVVFLVLFLYENTQRDKKISIFCLLIFFLFF